LGWAQSYVKKHNLRTLDVCFHGGEPFINYDVMFYLATSFREAFPSIEFSVVTNGSLITAKNAIQLKDIGVSTWQITLDGMGENHNRSRPIIGQDAFRQISNNLQHLREVDRVKINVNVSRSNVRTIEKDIIRFISEGAIPPNARIVISLVRNLSSSGFWQLPSREAGVVMGRLISVLGRNGHRYVVDDALASAMCSALHPHAFVISPTGVLRQCISAVEREFAVAGSVLDTTQNVHTSALSSFARLRWRVKPCCDCRYLPICMGRCAFESIAKLGRGVCRRSFFDTLCKVVVKEKFHSRMLDLLNN